MKCRFFLTSVFHFPFRKKRLVNLFLICSFVIGVSAYIRAEDSVRQVDALNAKQLIKRAEKLSRKGEVEAAEKILRHVIETYPQESKAKLSLAYILQKQRRLLEAYNLSIEVAKADSKNAFAFAVLGATFLNVGNFKEAKLSFLNALQLNKKEALAWAGLGTLDFYENRIFIGLDNLRAAVYFEYNNPEFLFTLAQIATRAEKYTEAAEAYDRFLQVSPETDSERRDRIKGLINFLRFLGNKPSLYDLDGSKQTVVSFKLVNNRPIIQLKVNDKDEPLNFVLDTGSGISVISKETADRFNVKSITRGGLARALGGNGKFEIIYGFLRSVSIGDVKVRNVPVYIRNFHNKDEKIDGYIGLALISKFLTTIDYGNSTFALQKKVFTPNSSNESLSLPLRLTSSGFLSGEVELEGVEAPLNFIVDTGASVSVISDEIANTKEISQFVKAEKMRVIGAAGITEDVSSFTLPRVSFGTHSRKSVTAIALNLDIINEASGFVQAGILGGNFLKNYVLTFDFENSKVIFVPVKK